MLSGYDADRDSRIVKQLQTAYRARPFTKAVPFNKTFVGGADEVVNLWVPVNAYFEAAIILIRASIAGVDLALCDSTKENPFMFVMAPTTIYQTVDIQPGYRSLSYNGARLVANDPAANAGLTIKGVIYGWEITQEGYYR